MKKMISIQKGSIIWVKQDGLKYTVIKNHLDKPQSQQVKVLEVQSLHNGLAIMIETKEGSKLTFSEKHQLWIE